jgi:uncharacterized protein YoxC
MKIKVTYLSALLLLLAACNGIQVSEKLEYVDSLIVREQYDSAGVLLQDVAETKMSEEEQAHYYLLTTQLSYIINHPLPSDSLLDLAITYYNKVENNQKLANAYYYKSYRSEINENFSQAIMYGKKAERLAMETKDMRLQYKIVESLAYLNALCNNSQLQLQYAMKALALAQKVHNKRWTIYSYNNISFAFYNLGQRDSVNIYIEKSKPYFEYVHDSDKVGFLTNIGLLYKEMDSRKAKEYFVKALTYGEHPGTLEHLADVYYAEGNKEKAYSLWKQALTTNGGIGYDKGNLIHSILTYDLLRGKLDEASKNLDEIIAIKDSIITVLRNDTIKDLQLRFDHEVAMHEVDKKLVNTQRIIIVLVLIVGVMALYIIIRRKKIEALQKEHQMRLYAYTTEINQLKANKDNTLNRIRDLESRTDKDSIRINELEEEAKKADLAIQTLNKSIKKLLDDEAPKLKKGRMLYDHILEGGTTSRWSSKEENLFNNYYAAINYQSYNRLKRVKRTTKLSAHNLFYLILKEMGKSDEEVRRILGLSLEGLRTIRSRTKPIE